MGLFMDDSVRFGLYISACRELRDTAEGIRERLSDAAPNLLVEAPRRRDIRATEDLIHEANLVLLLAPNREHLTADVAWEAGFAMAREKTVVYCHTGDDHADTLRCSESVALDSPQLGDFLYRLLLNTESFGASGAVLPDASEPLLRRLTTEIQEQLPEAQARFTLNDVRAIAQESLSQLIEPFADATADWTTPRAIAGGCSELSEVLLDLEASVADRQLTASALERAFVATADRAHIRRLIARGMEARADLLDAIAVQDPTGIDRQIRTLRTWHGELLAAIDRRQQELTTTVKLLVRAA